jgi:hypothetical protein
MKSSVFRELLVMANKQATVAAYEHDDPRLRGDCVVVTDVPPRCMSVAIKLGAEPVDAGLLFAPAEVVPWKWMAVAMKSSPMPHIRSKRVWAHTFQRALVNAGFKAYVMTQFETDQNI